MIENKLLNQPAESRDGLFASDAFQAFYQTTQKEIEYVQSKNQQIPEHELRLGTDTCINPGAEAGPGLMNFLNSRTCTARHKAIVFHSLRLHLSCFHQSSKPALLIPKWLRLAIQGSGLRAFSTEYSDDTDRLFRALGLSAFRRLAQLHVTDPVAAYRLAQIELSEALLNPDENPELHARLSISRCDNENEALSIVSRFGPMSETGATLAALFTANAVKRKTECGKSIAILEAWLTELRRRDDLDSSSATKAALIFNAVNLFHLKAGNASAIRNNFAFIESRVIPLLQTKALREHIVGNWKYQQAIISRISGDLESEIDHLISAASLDQYFTTIYYRVAQILHDSMNPAAGTFYEMALALSPINFSTANDYGFFLHEQKRDRELESWSGICQSIFPEKF